MTPIAQRLTASRDVTVFAALDTMDLLSEHLINVIGTAREFTLLTRYRNASGRDVGSDTGLADTKITTSLRVEDIAVNTNKDWMSFHAYLTPGIDSIGFGANADNAATEKQVIARYARDTPQDITVVHIDAWPGHPSREDRIHIEDWNIHGVCHDTVLAFHRLHTDLRRTEQSRPRLRDTIQ